MGTNESAPVLESTIDELNLSGENIEMIPYNIPPDHPIKSLLLSHNRLELIPQKLLNLATLDISYNEIAADIADSEVIEYPNLKSITLSGNHLDHIPKSLFNSLNITDLIADRNKFCDDTVSLAKFEHLENLDLFLNMYKKFPELPQSLVSLSFGFNFVSELNLSLPNLTQLRVPGCGIKIISTDCQFPNLRLLDISMNNLCEVPPIDSIFPKLETLYISFNYIHEFPKSLPLSIVEVNASHNVIEEWNDNIDHLQSLTSVDVSHNKLLTIPKVPLSLTTFNCDYNFIDKFEYFNFECVQQIQLSHNNFHEVPNLSKCTANGLYMTHNFLEEINMNNISKVITRFDFTKNMIKEIPLDIFLIERVQTLNLNSNNLTSLPSGIASSSLTSLFISENNIKSLPELPPNLMTICAVSCGFEELPKELLNCPRLSHIDFSNNKITKIEKFPACRRICLSYNQIKDIPTIPDQVSFLDLSHNQLKHLKILGEFIMLQDLDISHNKLINIEHSSLPLMTSFKISHNPLNKYVLDFTKLPALKMCDVTFTSIHLPQKVPDTIKEFDTSDAGLYNRSKSPKVRLFQPRRCGYSEACGPRPSMEDALIIRSNIDSQVDIYAVIDGHGGTDTAILSAFFIPQYFVAEKSKGIAAFSSIIKRLIERLKKANVRDGATIAFTIVTPDEIGCAYLGDSRALLIRKSGAVCQLSFDHKPTDPAEIMMIKENRSFVSEMRTAGILAMSRAIGDFNIPGVSHVPDMTSAVRSKEDYRLVLACDGVFDVVSQDEIGTIAVNEKDVNVAAAKIRNLALGRVSQDNISVIVVDVEKKK
ncbi:Leucine Rich Repeat family protein [Trichomonas vaginalis G3]|uniref:Leucine Rich Repeat family protein n=1 Tax=Trichomonas vaginalis (strain ATCC PRA-98 / G3) TaxID=412133 RepID=A2ELC0_TRIV3|nr:uncharacterized protein TVAGG3_0274310 [Trichomonas vaginalis G3]EAY06522.1 Leucine Rich Repeat family protein [Trichomonas vaginalis G3]KAI5526091.1 cAMP biosynthetic process [Trichomonas vaginalis G3]|eukprot:XP_001318745.1 hypothetical protein [Trichomonas vaginalis G3]